MKTQASEASALRLFGCRSLLVWCLAVSFSILAEGFGYNLLLLLLYYYLLFPYIIIIITTYCLEGMSTSSTGFWLDLWACRKRYLFLFPFSCL